MLTPFSVGFTLTFVPQGFLRPQNANTKFVHAFFCAVLLKLKQKNTQTFNIKNQTMGQNDDLIKAGTSYAAGQSIMSNAAYNLRKQAEEMAKLTKHNTTDEVLQENIAKYILAGKQVEAFEWLNECIQTEIIGEAKQQKNNSQTLDKQIERIKVKYQPIYDKIGMAMPANIADSTGESICNLLGIELLTQEFYDKQKIEREKQESREGCGLAFRAVLMIGMLSLLIFIPMCS